MLRRRRVLTLPEAQHLCRRVAEACCYLHENGVIHRDIKLDNILLAKGMVAKLTDFGLAARLSRAADASRRRTRCGTVQYMAPEVLDRTAAGHGFGADVWSLGCVLVTLLTGRPPVRAATMEATLRSIRDSPWRPPAALCPVTRAFLGRLLCQNPEQRPGMAEVLRDQFFRLEPQLLTLPESCLSQQPRLDRLMPPPMPPPPPRQAPQLKCPRKPLGCLQTGNVNNNSNNTNSNANRAKQQPPADKISVSIPKVQTADVDAAVDAAGVDGGVAVDREGAASVICERPPLAPGDHSRYLVAPQSAAEARAAAADLLRVALASTPTEAPDLAAPLWVARWMDCLPQGYGFAYELSDGSVGARFNDASSLVRAQSAPGCVQFYDADGRERLLSADCAELAGRVRLLDQLAAYMRLNLGLAGGRADVGGPPPAARVNFRDHVKLVLCPSTESVTLMPPNGSSSPVRVFAFNSDAAGAGEPPPPELRNRLQLCLNLVTSALCAQHPEGGCF
uniref:Polo kinase n=1 Tax=Macrostomum lignano TaxID=282301 RepID=A0A1I8IKM8_9PLAT